ncbi:hypothetical protein [Arthrobacter koreensis]|uniref:hypothetical protein n=1 Tax=Arthrobacter koreensis TaxID=199136 RepID=UPI00382FBC26
MSRNQKKPGPGEAYAAAAAEIDRVTAIIANVLHKFPSNTISPEIKPFIQCRQWAFRVTAGTLGSFGKTVSLQSHRWPNKSASFPSNLLGAQDSEITRWTRTQYWTGVELQRQAHRQAARDRLTAAQRAVEDAQSELDAAAKALTASYANKRQRRTRRVRGSGDQPPQ